MFPRSASLTITALLLLPPALLAQTPQPFQTQQQATAKVLTLPIGTTVPIRLNSGIDTKSAKPGDAFEGSIAANVFSGAFVALPIGTPITGRVVEAKAAGRLVGAAELTLELVSAQINGQSLAIQTRQLSSKNNGRGTSTATRTGGGAAIGAVIGGLAGGGAGAGIGAASGGALGLGSNILRPGQQIVLTTEALLQFQTAAAVEIASSTGVERPALSVRANTNSSPQPSIILNQSDPYTFDIVGLRLGMTAQQASTALRAKVPQATTLKPEPGAPQFTPAARFTGNLLANGPKFSVLMSFTETYPFDPQRPEQLTGIFYKADLTTAADRENFEQAVLSKYGPPVRFTKGVGAGWCNIGIPNGPTGYICAPNVPNLVFASNELTLGDPSIAVKERAAWNRQTSVAPPL